MDSYKAEIKWKRENGTWIYGGAPVAHTGRESGLLLRLNLLQNLNLGGRVLSVGCGTAAELRPLTERGFFALALDPERSFLLDGKAKANAEDYIQAIGEKMPLHNNVFDVVLLFEVLEHVINPDAVLKEINRVLKPDQLLLLTVPNKLYLFETHGVQICGKQIGNLLKVGIPFFSILPDFLRRRFERARIYSEAHVLSLLRRNGFYPSMVEYIMPSLDARKQTPLTEAMRQVSLLLSRAPLIRKFGSNIAIVSRKKTAVMTSQLEL